MKRGTQLVAKFALRVFAAFGTFCIALQTKRSINRFDLCRVNRSGSLNPGVPGLESQRDDSRKPGTQVPGVGVVEVASREATAVV